MWKYTVWYSWRMDSLHYWYHYFSYSYFMINSTFERIPANNPSELLTENPDINISTSIPIFNRYQVISIFCSECHRALTMVPLKLKQDRRHIFFCICIKQPSPSEMKQLTFPKFTTLCIWWYFTLLQCRNLGRGNLNILTCSIKHLNNSSKQYFWTST